MQQVDRFNIGMNVLVLIYEAKISAEEHKIEHAKTNLHLHYTERSYNSGSWF